MRSSTRLFKINRCQLVNLQEHNNNIINKLVCIHFPKHKISVLFGNGILTMQLVCAYNSNSAYIIYSRVMLDKNLHFVIANISLLTLLPYFVNLVK